VGSLNEKATVKKRGIEMIDTKSQPTIPFGEAIGFNLIVSFYDCNARGLNRQNHRSLDGMGLKDGSAFLCREKNVDPVVFRTRINNAQSKDDFIQALDHCKQVAIRHIEFLAEQVLKERYPD
jgi:hypothetical protein